MTTSRGSYAKGVAKRREILDAALEVVARNGYSRTSVRELADAVGLSQAGLLHYFDSKEHLFAEVLRHRDELSELATGRDATLDDFVEVIRRNAEVPGLVQLHAQLSTEAGHPDHPAHDYFVQRYARLRAALVGLLERDQLSGPAATMDVDLLAALCIAVADGMQTQWLLDRSVDMPAAQAALVTLLRGAAGD